MSQPIIEVSNLSKSYKLGQIGMTSLKDDLERMWAKLAHRSKADQLNVEQERDLFWALKDVSFNVNEGEVLGIIGKNGAGKSTLLKLLSRITEPTSGRAILRGRVASLLEVGTGFHPDLTGRENVYLNGATLGMTKREIDYKFDDIVAFSGVEKFIDTPVKRYSSGMTVRLGFAVAAHLEPEILIVDEVLAVGDAEFQDKCIKKMKDVASGGRTVIFVSHSMSSVERLCDKAILLESGEIVLSGTPKQCITDYFGSSISAKGEILLSTQGIQLADFKTNNQRLSSLPLAFSFMEPLLIEFSIFATQSYRSCALIISIVNANGQTISHCNTPEEGVRLFDISANVPTKVSVRANHLCLFPGRYFLGIKLLQHGSIDHILNLQEALRFTITERELVGGSCAYSSNHGDVRVFDFISVNEKSVS